MILQKKPYGCGLYALANLFGDLNFANAIFINKFVEHSKNGLTIGLLNKLISNFLDKNLSIEPLYVNKINDFYDPSVFDLKSMDQKLIPLFFVKSFGNINHIFCGFLDNNGIVIIFDSLCENYEITSLSKLKGRNIFGVYTLCAVDNGEQIGYEITFGELINSQIYNNQLDFFKEVL